MKIVFISIALIFFFTGCSQKKYEINQRLVNKTVNSIISKETENYCSNTSENIKLDVIFSSNFKEPLEYEMFIGAISGSWDTVEYNGIFKKDFENAIKTNFGNLCKYTFDESKPYKRISITINEISLIAKDINVEDNYVVPLVGLAKTKYDGMKFYSYDINLSGNFFKNEQKLKRNFSYYIFIDSEANNLLGTRSIESKIIFKNDNTLIFNLQGKLDFSTYTRLLNSNGFVDMKLYSPNGNLIYDKKPSNENKGIINNSFTNTEDLKISEMFGYFILGSRNHSGIFTYMTYDMTEYIIKNKER